ncbi:uncharacterized protein LOC123673282 [Harmonia axyridis]|uniref:uncharacterized protein LOC123673282 n=1 Tax=Harmonia axyridis TaxID=115357 RepID=UPI001E2790A3|nr:uncharacterized protein LOC123673282 [Harmonia axyridis]
MTEIDNKRMLTSRRAGIKGSITRFDKYLKKISTNPLTRESTFDLETRLNAITSLLSEFNTIQTEIEFLEPNDVDVHDLERDEFETKYFSVVSQAKMKLSKPVTSTASVVSNHPMTNVKLPDIKLIEFNGSYDKWTQFQETFDAFINQNKMLTDIQRFFYLQSSLKGEAAQIIASLNATEANYKIAWDLLRERYQNRKAIINSHMKAIFDLPNIPKESHSLLRKFLDEFQKHFRSLKSLGENVDEWHTILIFLLNSKLDSSTRKEWEIFINDNNTPKIENFLSFLTQRCSLLESLDTKAYTSDPNNISNKKSREIRSYSHLSTKINLCPLCNQSHFIYSCKEFLDIPIEKRFAEIKRHRLCSNCLRPGHSNYSCRSKYSCRFCRKKHHTLLHDNSNDTSKTRIHNQPSSNQSHTHQESNLNTENISENLHTHSVASQVSHCTYTILSTAILNILDRNGKTIKCRALLDSGSQSNFITKKLFDKLNLGYNSVNIPISGLSQNLINISKRATIQTQSICNNYTFKLPYLIIDKITGLTPQQKIPLSHFKFPGNICLADPTFHIPSDIDMLLGAGIFFDLLSCGQIKLGKGLPILQETKLGWIISGPLSILPPASTNSSFLSTSKNIQSQDSWQIKENFAGQQFSTKQETECESHFSETFTRDNTGRFTVSLHSKENNVKLSDPAETAINRFHAIERILDKNPLKAQYSEYIAEYQNQGLSDTNNWNHGPSKENPADIISRGINPTDLEGADSWWHGPHFQFNTSDNWPQERHISNYSRTASTLDEYN